MKREPYKENNSTQLACPCGSDKHYQNCCRPIHNNYLQATTPETLMRARYSAYALGNEDFILDTWAIETRPASLALNPQTRWISLTILKQDELSSACTHNMVSFSAFFIERTQLFELTETSTFICRGGTWYYLEGESTIKTIKLSGSKACPCGSGKKCKRCCIRN